MTINRGSATLALACTFALAACKASESAARANATPIARGIHPEWSKNSVIYEVNIRQYTPEGTFAAFTKELPRIKSLGVDILWIMPVQPIGILNRKGSLGSYYSISNYTAVNPEFGNAADFKAMVDAAHAQGFKIILDWVANHTAFDHAWTTAHKDWYTLRPDGSISRAIDDKGKETDWSDVADLNYESKPMRAAMIGEMQWWLDNTGIDGFRCDIAGFVPNDFWQQVSDAFRPTRPGFFMLAEAEDPKLHSSFDMTYGWELYHLMNDITQGKKGTSALTPFLATQDSLYGSTAYRMNFTSNHDENSWNGTEFERMGADNVPAYVLSAVVKNSMPLLYTGMEVSLHKRLKFFDKDTVDWSGPSQAAFYRSIFALKHQNVALWNGPWGGTQHVLTTNGGDRVFALTREHGANSVAVFVNFDSTDVRVAYQALTNPGDYTDWLSKATVNLPVSGTIDIPKHGYRVLVRGALAAESK